MGTVIWNTPLRIQRSGKTSLQASLKSYYPPLHLANGMFLQGMGHRIACRETGHSQSRIYIPSLWS